ncbi:MAG TPA: TonB family protein, partial [Allosphingosinicella sp.]
PGVRKGCTYAFHRRQTEPLRAPPPPEEAAFRPADATCPSERPAWAHMPPLVFPEEFRRRAIEGWAVLRYDVAPWGATGNVSVLASEPAAAFGEQAVRIVSGARRAAGTQGYTGCVTRVIFILPPGDGEPDLS